MQINQSLRNIKTNSWAVNVVQNNQNNRKVYLFIELIFTSFQLKWFGLHNLRVSTEIMQYFL